MNFMTLYLKIDIKLLNNHFPTYDLIKQIKIIINVSDNNLCCGAAVNGYLDCLKYTHKRGYLWIG